MSSREALTPTTKAGPVRDIIQDKRMSIKRWVDKTNWPFAYCKSLLVDLQIVGTV